MRVVPEEVVPARVQVGRLVQAHGEVVRERVPERQTPRPGQEPRAVAGRLGVHERDPAEVRRERGARVRRREEQKVVGVHQDARQEKRVDHHHDAHLRGVLMVPVSFRDRVERGRNEPGEVRAEGDEQAAHDPVPQHHRERPKQETCRVLVFYVKVDESVERRSRGKGRGRGRSVSRGVGTSGGTCRGGGRARARFLRLIPARAGREPRSRRGGNSRRGKYRTTARSVACGTHRSPCAGSSRARARARRIQPPR